MTDSPTVVLVMGICHASGFAGIISEIEAAGHTVVAPPNPLRSLAADAAAIHAVVASIARPVVLVGHSYGGAVITQASATLSNVSALVYLAAFGIDEGESCASVQRSAPAVDARDEQRGDVVPGARSARRPRSVHRSRHLSRGLLRGLIGGEGLGDARHAASAVSGRLDRECDRGWMEDHPDRGISSRTKTTRSRPKPRCSWPTGWAQRPSTSTVLTQHSSRSHRSPPRSLRRRPPVDEQQMTARNHLARRRGLTAPRHPLPASAWFRGVWRGPPGWLDDEGDPYQTVGLARWRRDQPIPLSKRLPRPDDVRRTMSAAPSCPRRCAR